MGFFRIFPAAAGIIALTATVSFARDQRECEEGEYLQNHNSRSAVNRQRS